MKKEVITALITPFDKGMKVNFIELKKLLDFQIKEKVDKILLCGTTGESETLSFKEKIAILKFSRLIVSEKTQLMMGISSNNTNEAIKLIKASRGFADCFLVTTPFFNKTNNNGLIKHFKELAKSTIMDIFIYNVPSRTNMKIEIDILKELSKITNIKGIKEASGDIAYFQRIVNEIRDFKIYTGCDDLIYLSSSLGCSGVISVISNISVKETRKILSLKDKQLINLNFINALFEDVNPIGIKNLMKYIGFDTGDLRLPLTNLDEKVLNKIKKEYDNSGFNKIH